MLYINDLPDDIQSEVFLFADDTKVFRRIENKEDIDTLQEDLNRLSEWSSKWLIKFHPDKCKHMTIGSSKGSDTSYKLLTSNGQHDIKSTDYEKDIGVIIDSNLQFEQHINEKINKASKAAAMVRRSFDFLNEHNFAPLYKSMVRSHLDTASSVWFPYKKKHTTAVENDQRRATKQLPGFKDLSYGDRLRKLKLPSLAYRRECGDMIEVYKIMHGDNDLKVADFLLKANNISPEHGTRGNGCKLFAQHSKRDIRKYSFSLRVVRKWNSLPENVVDAPSVQAFIRRLDRHWANQNILYDFEEKLEL